MSCYIFISKPTSMKQCYANSVGGRSDLIEVSRSQIACPAFKTPAVSLVEHHLLSLMFSVLLTLTVLTTSITFVSAGVTMAIRSSDKDQTNTNTTGGLSAVAVKAIIIGIALFALSFSAFHFYRKLCFDTERFSTAAAALPINSRSSSAFTALHVPPNNRPGSPYVAYPPRTFTGGSTVQAPFANLTTGRGAGRNSKVTFPMAGPKRVVVS